MAELGTVSPRVVPAAAAAGMQPAMRARVSVPLAFPYHASIDGLRALAVLAVIAFHFDYPWARGGFLAVDLFFVLSGFLITTLLITEWRRTGTVVLRAFWARLARRLLPARLVLLVGVAIYTRLEVRPWDRAAIRGDGLASLFYFANWRFIADEQGYFQLFTAVSPLRHMWSLAIEEQFYVVWPLVVYAVLRVTHGSRRALGAVCGVGVVASVAAMAVSYGSAGASRAYYGTDARAHTILMGALLAVVLSVWSPSPAARRRLVVVGVAAFGVMIFAWHVATGTSSRYYHGGSIAYAALACLVVAGALPRGVLRTALANRPLVWIGRLSYGLYLFHWPLIVWLVPTRVHLHGPALNALRLTLTFAASMISYFLIEAPIRERRRIALRRRPTEAHDRRPVAPKRSAVRWLALPAIGITLAIVLASGAGSAPAPSYLVGTRTPAFSAPTIPTTRGVAGPSRARTSSSTRATPPALRARIAPQPRTTFPWSYGDPLFCGTPRPGETREAVDAAGRFAPPRLARQAAGLRILVLGDSTACSLYPGLKAVGDEVGADVAQAAVFGCGVASGHITTTRGEQITPHSERCPTMVAEAQGPAVAAFRPDVVIWMSIWEKSDVIAGGSTLASGTAAGDAEMLRRMDATLAGITAYGARVVMVTVAAPAPNDAQGASNTSNAVDNASYARLDSIDRRFAARHAGTVTLVDLARRLCPDGPPCPEHVDGLRMRPDGRHLTPTAASIAAQWLMPRIVAAART